MIRRLFIQQLVVCLLFVAGAATAGMEAKVTPPPSTVKPKPAPLALEQKDLEAAIKDIIPGKTKQDMQAQSLLDDNLQRKQITLTALHVKTIPDLQNIKGNRLKQLKDEWYLFDQATLKAIKPLVSVDQASQIDALFQSSRDRLLAPKQGAKN